MPKKIIEKEVEEKVEEDDNDFSIKALKTAKSTMPLRACQKSGLLPRHPCSFMFSGRSGSGKSNALISILTRKNMLKDYFHTIIVYSPTAGSTDDLYAHLKLPKENFVEDFSKESLEELINCRKKLIAKKGIEWVGKNSRVLIILDDVIASTEFLNSPAALVIFSLLRHYHVSVFVLMQSYRKLPRSLRINCNALAVFPASQSEIEVLLEEVTPAGMRKREFEQVIDYATKEQHSFLYINNHAKRGNNIRKNLNEIIDLEKFKGKR
jgi:hypothetical protein